MVFKNQFQVKIMYADFFEKIFDGHPLLTFRETRKRNGLIKVPSIFDFLSIKRKYKTF